MKPVDHDFVPPLLPGSSGEKKTVTSSARRPPRHERRRMNLGPEHALPDARDGLTRLERVLLVELVRLEAERPGRPVSTLQLYGRVLERLDCPRQAFEAALARLGAGPG